MRPCDIDRSGDGWIYAPNKHKTDYLEQEKFVPLGLKSQKLIRPFLEGSDDEYLFSPREAETWRNEYRALHRKPDRKTKVYPCELRARERRKLASPKRKSKRPKRARYDTDAYRRAITYGITKASKAGLDITAIASYFSTKLSRMRSKMSVERLALQRLPRRLSFSEVSRDKMDTANLRNVAEIWGACCLRIRLASSL